MSLTAEPSEIYAGDSVSWTRKFEDYPASTGWTLTYNLRSSENVIDISGDQITADGKSFVISVTADVTANWYPGTYSFQAWVEKDSEVHTVLVGMVTIFRNFAKDTAPFDARSHARKCYDAICAVLEGRATSDAQEYTIFGRMLRKMPIKELLEFKNYYAHQVVREEGRAAQFYGAAFGDPL